MFKGVPFARSARSAPSLIWRSSMRRQIVLLTLLVPWLATTAYAVPLTGWISDESCGADHVKPGKESCVEKCLRGGASVGHPEWVPQRMVLVTDDGKTIWIVENPEALKGLAGRHVAVDATFHSRTRSVRVIRLRMK
jgi:hypothetical protein